MKVYSVVVSRGCVPGVLPCIGRVVNPPRAGPQPTCTATPSCPAAASEGAPVSQGPICSLE